MDLAAIDFTDLDNFADGFPHSLVRRSIGREAPVYWHDADRAHPRREGFWSVATPEFSAAPMLQETADRRQVLNMMDDPRHAQIRRLVSSGLTARMIRLSRTIFGAGPRASRRDLRWRGVRLRGGHRRRTANADDLHTAGSAGVRTALAVRGRRAGVRFPRLPEGVDRAAVGGGRRLADVCLRLGIGGARSASTPPTTCCRSLPAPPIGLTDAELYLFFYLLFSAGAETTRNFDRRRPARSGRAARGLRRLRDNSELLPTVRVRAGGQAGGVDAQQPAHRHPPPGRAISAR